MPTREEELQQRFIRRVQEILNQSAGNVKYEVRPADLTQIGMTEEGKPDGWIYALPLRVSGGRPDNYLMVKSVAQVLVEGGVRVLFHSTYGYITIQEFGKWFHVLYANFDMEPTFGKYTVAIFADGNRALLVKEESGTFHLTSVGWGEVPENSALEVLTLDHFKPKPAAATT